MQQQHNVPCTAGSDFLKTRANSVFQYHWILKGKLQFNFFKGLILDSYEPLILPFQNRLEIIDITLENTV